MDDICNHESREADERERPDIDELIFGDEIPYVSER